MQRHGPANRSGVCCASRGHAIACASPPTLGHARGRSASESMRMHPLRPGPLRAECACTGWPAAHIVRPLQIPSLRHRREMLAGLQSVLVCASRRHAAPRSQWVGAAAVARPLSVPFAQRILKPCGLRYAASAMLSNSVLPRPQEHTWPNRSVEATRNGIGPRSAFVDLAPRGPMPSRAPHLQR